MRWKSTLGAVALLGAAIGVLPAHAGGAAPVRLAGWQAIGPAMRMPWALAVDGRGVGPNRWMYVVDTGLAHVVKLGTGGRHLTGWAYALAPNRTQWTAGVAVGGSGNVFVTDWAGNRVVKYSPQGRVLAALTGNDAAGALVNPGSVAVDPRGNVYVADTGNRRIVVFSPTGAILRIWSTTFAEGQGEGSPFGVSLLPDGDVMILVSCYQASCTLGHGDQQQAVLRYTSTGRFLRSWLGGSPHTGSAPGQLPWIMAQAIATDRQGHWYVTGLLINVSDHTYLQGVMKMSTSGKVIMRRALPGQGNPLGMTVDPDGVIYVTQGARIQKLTR